MICRTCNGAGYYYAPDDGQGAIIEHRCATCGGTGYVPYDRTADNDPPIEKNPAKDGEYKNKHWLMDNDDESNAIFWAYTMGGSTNLGKRLKRYSTSKEDVILAWMNEKCVKEREYKNKHWLNDKNDEDKSIFWALTMLGETELGQRLKNSDKPKSRIILEWMNEPYGKQKVKTVDLTPSYDNSKSNQRSR